MNIIKKLIKHPDAALLKVWRKVSRLIPGDRFYISGLYFISHRRRMPWKNPVTFNEKLNWLKLWSKDKDFGKYVDKYTVREHVATKIGENYLIPCLGVWDSVEDIDFDSLPDKYVLKTTHDSSGVVIVHNSRPDKEQIAKLKSHLKRDYFWNGREFPYHNLKPRIIAEKYMVDESGWDLKDYKIFCFNGEPEILFLASERFKSKNSKPKFDYFDMELNHLPISSKGHANNESNLKPIIPNFEKMKELAAALSAGFPFIRIDFYNINGDIYFGEMTFFHDDGVVPLHPAEWNKRLGDMITLPQDDPGTGQHNDGQSRRH